MTRHTVSHVSQPDGHRIAGRLTLAGTPLLLGLFIVISAGFMPIGVLHNAAHDTRHSFAFPCH
jgi:cobalt transporter subunit CbtB